MATKGQKMKFDEFSLVILGGIIFMGIILIGFTTPGEFPPKITPTEVTLDVDPGSSTEFVVSVSGRISEANISTSGQIAGWMQLSKTDLGATGPGENVTVTLNVPENAGGKTYTGKVTVKSKEGQASADITVKVSPVKRLSSRTFGIGDFTVIYSSGEEQIASHQGTLVTKSYIFEKPLSLAGEINEDLMPILKSGSVRFDVESTNNYGPIVVTQNGRQIFNEVVGPGEVVVPLNMSDLRKSNKFTIESGSPGIFFWTENLYDVRDVSVDVSFDGAVPRIFNFSLTPQEQEKFDHLQITYLAGAAGTAVPPLKVEMNGQIIYFEVPPRATFNEQISRDIFGGKISVADRNSISFSFDQDASYEIRDARMTVFSRVS